MAELLRRRNKEDEIYADCFDCYGVPIKPVYPSSNSTLLDDSSQAICHIEKAIQMLIDRSVVGLVDISGPVVVKMAYDFLPLGGSCFSGIPQRKIIQSTF